MRTMLVILALLAAGTAANAGSPSPVSYDYPWCVMGGERLFRRLLVSDPSPMPGVGIRAMEPVLRCQPAPPFPAAAGRGAADVRRGRRRNY
jgi:hypothetical protein